MRDRGTARPLRAIDERRSLPSPHRNRHRDLLHHGLAVVETEVCGWRCDDTGPVGRDEDIIAGCDLARPGRAQESKTVRNPHRMYACVNAERWAPLGEPNALMPHAFDEIVLLPESIPCVIRDEPELEPNRDGRVGGSA